MNALMEVKPSKVVVSVSLDGMVREGPCEERWSFDLRPGHYEGTREMKM